jgi:hypothetical protein
VKQGQPLSNMAMLMLLRELHAGVTDHGFRWAFRERCERHAVETSERPGFMSRAACVT